MGEVGLAPFWLSDKAWAAVEPHLPHNQRVPGVSMTAG